MNRAIRTWRQRITLWRIARRLRAQDPDFDELLAGRRASVLPPLRFTSVPVRAYVVVGLLLLVTGIYLSVGSAVMWGSAALLAAVARHHVQPPRKSPGPSGAGPEPEPGGA